MKIKDIMSSPVYVVSPDEPISRARNLMMKHKISRLVVMENNVVAGIVTKTDIQKRLQQASPEWRRRPIDEVPISLVMTESVIDIYHDAEIKQAVELMVDNKITGLVVIGEGEDKPLEGMVTRYNIFKYFSSIESDAIVGDIMATLVVTVHRHHTLSHVMHEMEKHAIKRVIVLNDKSVPVGIITSSNLAFTDFYDNHGEMAGKDVKMARRSTRAGQREYRCVKEVPLVAEDVMSSPVAIVDAEQSASDAAKTMVAEGIGSLVVMKDDEMIGMFCREHIIKELLK